MKNDGEFHLQLYATSPAPKRDYHGLTITSEHIILNSWDISRGPHVYPRRRRLSLDDFTVDKPFRAELQHLFGSHVLDYATRVAKKDNSLYSVPEKVFRKIIGYLAIGDIVRIGQSSKIFFELCNTNSVWKIIFRKKLGRSPNKTELDVSQAMPWRHMLHRRVMEKRENKRISENFKQGVKNLQHQTKKELERIRQNSRNETVSFDRKPPKEKSFPKIQIKTFKMTDSSVGNSGDITRKPEVTRTSDSEINRKSPEVARTSNSERNRKTPEITRTSNSERNRKPPEVTRTSNSERNRKPPEVTRTSNSDRSKKNVDSNERKVEIDQRTKSSHLLRSTTTTNIAITDKKLNKCAKDIQNLKSKSVLL